MYKDELTITYIYVTKGQSFPKQSTAGLNSEFSFSKTGCLTKATKLIWTSYDDNYYTNPACCDLWSNKLISLYFKHLIRIWFDT